MCALFLTHGCSSKPTYPKENLTNAVQGLLTQEAVTGSVRVIDHTLAVHVELPGTIIQVNQQIGLGPAVEPTLQKILGALHRVVLSTDADIRFYVILLSDPSVSGAYVTIVRYVDDIKQAYASRIGIGEIFSRTIFDVHRTNQGPMSLEQLVPTDIRLEDFLSRQLAQRIQQSLTAELQTGGLATVGQCEGNFQNGEFVFTLNVLPFLNQTVDEATMQKAFQISTSTIVHILATYRFKAFESIRLVHPLTGRHLTLPKTQLDVFR